MPFNIAYQSLPSVAGIVKALRLFGMASPFYAKKATTLCLPLCAVLYEKD